MSLFDDEEISDWLKQITPQIPTGYLEEMQKTEEWVMDGPGTDLRINLEALAEKLDLPSPKLNEGDKVVLVPKEDLDGLIKLLAYMRMGSSLRLTELLSRHQPSIASDLLSRSAKNCQSSPSKSDSLLVLTRLKQMIQLEVYHLLFNKKNRQEVLDILREIEV